MPLADNVNSSLFWPVGVAGLFMETHPNPAEAKSDGPNAVPLDRMKELLTQLIALDKVVRQGNMSSFTF